jgi:hypothetical protein
MRRSLIYQRAKNADETMAYGTRRDVYATNYEWACHSMWLKTVKLEDARCMIGNAGHGTTKPYSASVLNISAMSYGAISDNAILALNRGAKMGNFYHNTGEVGSPSRTKKVVVISSGMLVGLLLLVVTFRLCLPSVTPIILFTTKYGVLWMWRYRSEHGSTDV